MAYNLDITVFILFAFSITIFIENDRVMYGLAFIFICLYHAIMESSNWQATLGKKQGRMKVVTLEGKRISFGRALIRIIAKFVSLILLFGGFILIFVRTDRRGLHDLIAGTKVVLREFELKR
ncbi:MAG: RDD family protein [Reichenbachiella sp.]